MRAQPGQADRQARLAAEGRRREERGARDSERDERDAERDAIDQRGGGVWPPRHGEGSHGGAKKRCDAPQQAFERHGVSRQPLFFRRMPRPPPSLAAPSLISSMPRRSSAAISFISDSTLPRTTPSLASIRWIVDRERRAALARARWSMPARARAARSSRDVSIMKSV